jgi:hypothetical protein
MKMIQITSTGILSLILGVTGSAYAQHDQQGDKQDRPQEHQSQRAESNHEPQHHAQQQGQSEQRQDADHSQQPQRHEQSDRQQHAQQHQSDRTAQQQGRKEQSDRSAHQHAQQRQDQHDGQQHAQQQRQDRPSHSQSSQQERSAAHHPTPQQQRIQHSAWQRHGSRNWDSEHRTWQQRGGYHGYRIPDDRFRGYFGSNHGFRIYGLPFLVVRGYPRFQYEGYWFSPVDPWPEYWGSNWYDNDEVYVVYADNGYYMYNRRYPTMGIAINISM